MPNLGNARDQLPCLHGELLQLESHIRTVRESVQSAIAQSSESSHHAAFQSDEFAFVLAQLRFGGFSECSFSPRPTNVIFTAKRRVVKTQ